MNEVAVRLMDKVLSASVRSSRTARGVGWMLRHLPIPDYRRKQVARLVRGLQADTTFRRIGERIVGLAERPRLSLVANLGLKSLLPRSLQVGDCQLPCPRVISVFPTRRCNLGCRYCYVPNDGTADLPAPLFRRVLDEALAFRCNVVCIGGGEPLLFPGLLGILAEYESQLFLLFTNGWLLDAEAVQRLEGAANTVPLFAVDGRSATTDAVRGPGTWDRIARACRLLQARRLPFGFSCHVDRGNFEEVFSDGFVQTMLDLGCISGWYSYHLPTRQDDFDTTVVLPTQRVEALARMDHLRDTYPLIFIDSASDSRFRGSCSAGGNGICHVENTGAICPCPFLPFPAGNIRDMTIAEAMATPLFTRTRALAQIEAPRDHVAGCIALDKLDRMLDVVAEDPACLRCGEAARLSALGVWRTSFVQYQQALGAVIARDVTFRRTVSKGPRGCSP